MKTLFVLFGIMASVLILVACGGGTTPVSSAPVVQSNGTVPTPQPVAPGADGNYAQNYGLPAVTTVYSITGVVLAAPSSITQYSVDGRMSGSSYKGYGSVSGYIQGGTTGKGFVRFKVQSVEWHDPYIDGGIMQRSEDWTPAAKPGDVVLLKTIDSKASALGSGDTVTFLCREQNEFVPAVAVNEIPTTAGLTRELDYCRMLSSQFQPGE